MEEQISTIEGPEGWVLFAITGRSVAPERITDLTGIEPDRVYPGTGGEMIWQIHSSLPATEHLFRHFEEILMRLKPARRKIRTLSADCKAEFFCTMIRKRESRELFEVPPRFLMLIGYLGATLALDIIEKTEVRPAAPSEEPIVHTAFPG